MSVFRALHYNEHSRVTKKFAIRNSMKNSLILLSALLLQACSYTANIVLFNNADSDLVLCNRELQDDCVAIASREVGRIDMISNNPDTFRYSITSGSFSGKYTLILSTDIDYISKVYCLKTNASFCDIAVQFNADNKCYLRFPKIFWPADVDWLEYVSAEHGKWTEWINFKRTANTIGVQCC